MGMGYAPTWLRQVSPPPLLHKTTLTTGRHTDVEAVGFGPLRNQDETDSNE